MGFKKLFNISKIGEIVRLFVLADLALLAGWGLIQPLFAIFIVEKIVGATVVTVGVSAAIYWILKASLQIPIANFLDRTASEKDDFIVLISGLILASLSAVSFILIDHVWQLYLMQIVHGVAFAMYSPSWSGIFSRHLDKNHEALDWSLDSSAISFSAGVTALGSGLLVAWFGFNSIFILAGFFSFLSAAIIFTAPQVVFPHRIHRKKKGIKDHKPIAGSHQ